MPQLSPITLEPSFAIKNEQSYVHDVYESIADHFSQTRYKPWPLIQRFLTSLERGSIGLDSGTGNGKYLPVCDELGVHMIGLDRSKSLLNIAQSAVGRYRDVVWGDVLDPGWRPGSFVSPRLCDGRLSRSLTLPFFPQDFAISIATIHHLSTQERRCEAVKSLIRSVKPNSGRLLIYVWAVEQDGLSKRIVPDVIVPSDDGAPSSAKIQDVLVPWVKAGSVTGQTNSSLEPRVFQRYYHLFSSSELPELVRHAASELGLAVGPANLCDTADGACGMEIVEHGWERSNHYLEARLWRR
jgi:tRNA (uracil-5-)-methyltransferase TRM9